MLAALFTISLILLPLDYGVAGPGHNNIFYLLGDMLYSVYGFSSILIPGFLLIAGLSCFASKWTARKTLRLLTALIPFFTCVVTESIIRSIVSLDHSSFAIVKILIALVTGAMLVVIEFLGVGIIADKLNKGGFKNLRKAEVNTPVESIEDSNAEAEDTGFTKLSKISLPKKSFLEKIKSKFQKNAEEDETTAATSTAFDDILEDVEPYTPLEGDSLNDEIDEGDLEDSETKDYDPEVYAENDFSKPLNEPAFTETTTETPEATEPQKNKL